MQRQEAEQALRHDPSNACWRGLLTWELARQGHRSGVLAQVLIAGGSPYTPAEMTEREHREVVEEAAEVAMCSPEGLRCVHEFDTELCVWSYRVLSAGGIEVMPPVVMLSDHAGGVLPLADLRNLVAGHKHLDARGRIE